MLDQIQVHNKLKNIIPPNASRTTTRPVNLNSEEKLVQIDTGETNEVRSGGKTSYNILSMQAFEDQT